MRLCLTVLSCFIVFAYGQDCPAFPDWMPQTENCLWFPLNEMRQDMLDACGIEFDASQFPTPPPFPNDVLSQMPSQCGYCSFKFQCRKREYKDGCFPIDGKVETCTEHSDVCLMPKAPILNNCKWGMLVEMFKQCLNRPSDELADWKRQEMKKWAEMLKTSNCVEKDGKCACCCHPYKPNRDGTACEEVKEPSCAEYDDWNDWSECLWGMPQQVVQEFRSHCALGNAEEQVDPKKLELPEGFQMPEKCGFCSFKLRCRKRDRKDTKTGKPRCFPVEAEKRPCGREDCPTCGDVCELPKIKDSCNYGDHIRNFLKDKMAKINKMPYWRKRGMLGISKNLPHGNCVEIDGKCKCCCHPYAPNADGTQCELREYCKLPEDLGLQIPGFTEK